jgi:hypothetical protein
MPPLPQYTFMAWCSVKKAIVLSIVLSSYEIIFCFDGKIGLWIANG